MSAYTYDDVCKALNRACDDIRDDVPLPDTGVIDALNLLVNAALLYLEQPDATLAAAAGNYDIELTDDNGEPLNTDDLTGDEINKRTLAVIFDWIGEA